MSSDNRKNCGCGCLTIVLEAIGFMLICNFIGCYWAERGTQRLVNYAHQLWDGGQDGK